VDRFQDIAAGMRSRGYEGIFQRRTGDTRDGCAMFWKSKRLHLLEEDSIDFSEFDLRNNVAQICVFELNGAHKLVLGNIHVLFNPKRGDVKLGQVYQFTSASFIPLYILYTYSYSHGYDHIY